MAPESIRALDPTSDTLEIREAIHDPQLRELLLLADKAIRADGDAIGFLPFGAYEEAASTNRMFSLFRNNDRVGFILWGRNQLRECRILQIWVRSDARLIEHGRALVQHLENAHARRLQLWQLRAWVAEDLAANVFWPQIGFACNSWRWGPAKNGRRHNLWRRAVDLTTTAQLSSCGVRSPATPFEEIA